MLDYQVLNYPALLRLRCDIFEDINSICVEDGSDNIPAALSPFIGHPIMSEPATIIMVPSISIQVQMLAEHGIDKEEPDLEAREFDDYDDRPNSPVEADTETGNGYTPPPPLRIYPDSTDWLIVDANGEASSQGWISIGQFVQATHAYFAAHRKQIMDVVGERSGYHVGPQGKFVWNLGYDSQCFYRAPFYVGMDATGAPMVLITLRVIGEDTLTADEYLANQRVRNLAILAKFAEDAKLENWGLVSDTEGDLPDS